MTGKEILKLLKENGWELDRIRGSHHIMVKKNMTIAVPVHGNRDLPAGTTNAILEQGGLK